MPHGSKRMHEIVNPPMVKRFLLTYLVRGVATPSLNLNHYLSDLFILLSYRPILDLSEYKLKVVNTCEMHTTGGIEVVVFDHISDM